jgi:hypothetical protein
MSSSSDLFGLTISLLKLSQEINEPGGHGLCSIVLCAETPPDGRLNFGQKRFASRNVATQSRLACSPCCCDWKIDYRRDRDDPPSDRVV